MEYSLTRHLCYLQEKLEHFRERRQFVDVLLTLRDAEIPCHSVVIAAYSATLYSLLLHSPTFQNDSAQTVINLDSFDISATSLRKIVDFMYSGTLFDITPSPEAYQLKKAAEFLGVVQLEEWIDIRLDGSDIEKYAMCQDQESSFIDIRPTKELLDQNLPEAVEQEESSGVTVPTIAQYADELENDHIQYQNCLEERATIDPEISKHFPVEEIKTKQFVVDLKSEGSNLVGGEEIVDGENDETALSKGKPHRSWKMYKNDEGNYVCPHCNETFCTNLLRLKNHVTSEHESPNHLCRYCEKKFSTKKQCSSHENTHKESTPFSCPTCDKQFRSSQLLGRHKKTHCKDPNDIKPLLCSKSGCKETFPSKQKLRLHIRAHHKKEGDEKSCDLLPELSCDHKGCTYVTKSINALRQHKNTHVPLFARKRKLCEDCGASVLPGTLRMHRLKHSSVLHCCPHCTYTTCYPRYIASHIKRKHADQQKEIDDDADDDDGSRTCAPTEKPHKCALCPFSTFFQWELKAHAVKHLKEPPLKCDECEYRTVNNTLLKAHKRTHSGEKPFLCDVCAKSFRQSTHLVRHRRLHTGEKPHKCVLCTDAFIDKRMLEQHIYMAHIQLKPFVCHLCPYDCVKRDTLRQHMKKQHNLSAYCVTEQNKRDVRQLEPVEEEKAETVKIEQSNEEETSKICQDYSNLDTLMLAALEHVTPESSTCEPLSKLQLLYMQDQANDHIIAAQNIDIEKRQELTAALEGGALPDVDATIETREGVGPHHDFEEESDFLERVISEGNVVVQL